MWKANENPILEVQSSSEEELELFICFSKKYPTSLTRGFSLKSLRMYIC